MHLLLFFFIAAYGLVAGFGALEAYKKCRFKKSSYGFTPRLYLLYGVYVWADLVVFGTFWFLLSLICLLLQNYILFALLLSLFWVVRSVGETLYWFHQQFTPSSGNPPEKFWLHRIFQNDSVWFVNQIIMQCITVIALVLSLYFGHLFISSL